MITIDSFNYWKWLFIGIKDENGKTKSGLQTFWNYWLILHIVFAIVCMFVIKSSLRRLAETIIIPIVAILVGVSMSIMGVAQTLLVSDELIEFSKKESGGMVGIIYGNQTAVLTILITLALCLSPMMQINIKMYLNFAVVSYFARFIMCFFLSLSIRECWHVIKRTSNAMIAVTAVKERKKREKNNSK